MTLEKARVPGDAAAERNVFTLGVVAFFAGLAQDMVLPVLPLFYTTVLGLNKEFIGLIEGALTSVVSLARIGAGYLSDALGMRKAIVFAGYALSAIGRAGLALAGSGTAVLGLRLSDGLGKGLKDAPRDALVARSAGSRKLGFAFGVQRMLDTMGSFVGPLVTFVLLKVWVNDANKYRWLFATAGIVAAIPLVIIVLLVLERPVPVEKHAVSLRVPRGPSHGFSRLRSYSLSVTHQMPRAQGVGVPASLIPVVYAFFNLVSASTAIPAGRLADRVGRRRVIEYGWAVYALAYAGFALANAPWMIWALYGFYGLFYSLTEGSSKAIVAEFVPDEGRGAAYGLYSAAVGVMALPASVIAGALWTRVSQAAPFAFGAVLAAVSLVGLRLIPAGGRGETGREGE